MGQQSSTERENSKMSIQGISTVGPRQGGGGLGGGGLGVGGGRGGGVT